MAIPTVPHKTREYQDHHFDSTRWNNFQFRDDDVVVATYAKSGTTWMQQIVGQLIFNGAEDIPVLELSPWIDMRMMPLEEIMPMLEQQAHRRFLKTHLPVDALVFSPAAKYIYVARDGRDTVWSLYHHHSMYTQAMYDAVNNTPGRVGREFVPPEGDIVEYFHRWLDQDGYPYHEFWAHNQSWWDIRGLPNVLLVHFNNLKSDMGAEIRRVAQFLDIEIDEAVWPAIVEHCSFDYMKAHGDTLSPMLVELFNGGGRSFINKGTNGRWRDLLRAEDIAKYERIAAEHLTPDCARWLATGEGL